MRSKIRTSRDNMLWHLWWAWFPVKAQVSECTWQWVWLEEVERRLDAGGGWCGDWEYRIDSGDMVRYSY